LFSLEGDVRRTEGDMVLFMMKESPIAFGNLFEGRQRIEKVEEGVERVLIIIIW